MHALDPMIRKRVLQDLEPLEPAEIALLNQHRPFFKRFAVHDFAERLRKMTWLGEDTKKHIFYKRHWFMKAMVCYQTPKPGEVDPVEEYGLRRTNPSDMATLKTLQDSYKEVTMTCYEAGFIEYRSEWKTYLKHPGYWYQVLENYLVSKTHIDSWLAKLDPSRQEIKEAVPPQVEVMHWGNKLALLKHALARSDPTAAAGLDVDKVVRKLNTAAITHYSLAQVVDEDLMNHLFQASQAHGALQHGC
jgi:hypothetical protein